MFETLKAIGLGAGLMYFFDPDYGRRRRAKIRNRFEALSREVAQSVSEPLVEVGHRLRSLWDEATGTPEPSHPLPLAGQEPDRPAGDMPRPQVATEQLVLAALGGFLMARCAVKPTPWNVVMGTVGFGLFSAALPRRQGVHGEAAEESRQTLEAGGQPRAEPAPAEAGASSP